MTKILEIKVEKGDLSSGDATKLCDHILLSFGGEVWYSDIAQWRSLVNNIERKILNLHTIEHIVGNN